MVFLFKLRREVRLRKEYLYRKSLEDQRRRIQEKKQKLKYALDGMDNVVVIISCFKLLNQSSVFIKERISPIW